jgi:uncharacterized protein (TIRG00374 family)
MRRKKTGISGSPHDGRAEQPIDPPNAIESCGTTDAPFVGRATFWLAWGMGLAMLAVVVFASLHFTAGREFLHLIERAQPWWLALAIGLQTCTYLAQGEIWRLVARAAHLTLPVSVGFKLSLTKLFINQILPSGGLSGSIIVARVLEQHGFPRSVSMASVLVDGTAYYIAFATALAAALIITVAESDVIPLILASALLLVAVGTGLAARALLLSRKTNTARGFFLRIPLVRRAISRLNEADPTLTHNNRLLLMTTFAQLAIILLDTSTIWVLVRALGALASPSGVFTSFVASTLLRTLSIVPGGLGVFEAASVVTLQRTGISLPVSLAATLLFRGLSFWLPMAPGLLFAQASKGTGRRLSGDDPDSRQSGPSA